MPLAATVERAASRLAVAAGCAAHEYDLVSGLTGMGVYLLARHQLSRLFGAGETGETLTRAMSGLARLLAYPTIPAAGIPRPTLAAGSLREAYPSGHHNCGLAHGVAGTAGAAVDRADRGRRGARRPGRDRGHRRVAGRAPNRHWQEPDWPDAVPLDQAEPLGRRAARRGQPGRAAWCYGAPGVARSLWLAGTAMDRTDWRELAASTIRAVARRPPEMWWLSTPAFCHGRAGLLQVLRRFADDLADPGLAATAEALAADIAAEYDPASVLGVRGVEPEGVLVDHPGLLDGAPGIALALLGLACGRRPLQAGWDRMFLLS